MNKYTGIKFYTTGQMTAYIVGLLGMFVTMVALFAIC